MKSLRLAILFIVLLAGIIMFGCFAIKNQLFTFEPKTAKTPTPTTSLLPTLTLTPIPSLTPTPPPSPKKTTVLLEVPFTSQAPLANWEDPKKQDGCEEASILIASLWVEGKKSISKEEADKEIDAISAYELEQYGYYQDASAADTAKLMQEYYGHEEVSVSYYVSTSSIKAELARGNLVITPLNGRKLGNPNYTPPGPDRHMIVIRGYDDSTGEFITNDPGTRKGELYRYPYSIFVEAIRDYPSGIDVPLTQTRKAMIIVQKEA